MGAPNLRLPEGGPGALAGRAFGEAAAGLPNHRGNVYHNFSCPQDRCRLVFDPFESNQFKCPLCGKTFPPETDAGIYPPGDRYHGTV